MTHNVTRFRINTNGMVQQPLYLLDRDHLPVELDIGGSYRCEVRDVPGSGDPVLTFVTGGGSGFGTIEVIHDLLDGEIRDYFYLEADVDLVTGIPAGAYFADIIKTDSNEQVWIVGFGVQVFEGVTD